MLFCRYRYLLFTPVARCSRLFASFPFRVCYIFQFLGLLYLVHLVLRSFLRLGFRCFFGVHDVIIHARKFIWPWL